MRNSNLKRTALLAFAIIILTFYLSQTKAYAQEVLATAGESFQTSSSQISFTVGQLMNETVSNNTILVTQGFHQTFDEAVAVLDVPDLALAIQVYPNPSYDFLKIVSEDDQEIHYTLYNLLGLKIANGKFHNNTQLAIERFAKGHYQLLLTNPQQQLLQTFKIQFQ